MNAKHTRIWGLAIVLTATLGISGCSSSKRPLASSGNVNYEDASVAENLTNEISTNDFNQLAKAMTDSLLTSNFARSNSGKGKPSITISPVKNRTSDHIKTNIITNKIEDQVTKSGIFEFIADRKEDEELQLEDQRQNQSGQYRPSKGTQNNIPQGAEYVLLGEITSDSKVAGDIKVITYTFQLKLVDRVTRRKVWIEEKEIRKTSERSTF